MLKNWLRKYYPVVATCIFELGAAGQIYRMISEQSSAGQNVFSWLLSATALFGFGVWYHYVVPNQKPAKYGAIVSGCMNIGVVITTLYFRYI